MAVNVHFGYFGGMALIVKDGIRIRSGPGRPLPLRPRSAAVPYFWRPAGDGARTRVSEQMLTQWMLVLRARNIPFLVAHRGGRRLLYVPPLAEGIARYEIAGYSAEPVLRADPPAPPVRLNALPAALFFMLLLGWHGICAGWWEFPWLAPLPPKEWARLGALDAYRARVLHEWYRTVTALSLHVDSLHIFSNIAAGCLFLTLLRRRVGFAAGLFLTVLGGVSGNICNALYRPLPFVSMGFSTALFACLGLLSSIHALQEGHGSRRKALLPLGAGAGLFAMFGTEGERADYAAHLFGMAAGLVLGYMYCRLLPRIRPCVWMRATAAAAVPVLFVLAWRFALR
ncbi:MAG: rhomboid family intramembrane serine protease [Deltaproteobacteria bacterium]|jgi:membrane associated rhomboid family serine protease|nr:rhomboid family intramembrane serine protease [Deltaproteobacteria bacterium]